MRTQSPSLAPSEGAHDVTVQIVLDDLLGCVSAPAGAAVLNLRGNFLELFVANGP